MGDGADQHVIRYQTSFGQGYIRLWTRRTRIRCNKSQRVNITFLACFTQRDYFQVQFQIPNVVKRARLFQQLSKYQAKQILCKKVIQVIKMNCEGNTTWLTKRDCPETGDLIDWQQCTYIITNTDHQMFLDLRTSQTEPTGTLYGSWERKCLKLWVWSPFCITTWLQRSNKRRTSRNWGRKR